MLTIYFAYGLISIAGIAETFWLKQSAPLSADQLIAISIWANLPWAGKIILAECMDGFPIRGSKRYAYGVVGAIFMAAGQFFFIAAANHYTSIIEGLGWYYTLLLGNLLLQVGLVIQDLVADTLCYEIVVYSPDKTNATNDEQIRYEINSVQLLSRIAATLAAFIAAASAGLIATHFTFATISIGMLLVPLISVLGIAYYPHEPKLPDHPLQGKMLAGGGLYIMIAILVAIYGIPNGPLFIFITGTLIVSYFLFHHIKQVAKDHQREIGMVLLILFLYRIRPGYSPGIEWWKIDVLHFTPHLFATLNQITTILGVLGIWLFSGWLRKASTTRVLTVVMVIEALLQLPWIGLSLGLHQWTEQHLGIGAQSIALIDAAAEGPFHNMAFLVLCMVATHYAPKEKTATWFALVMSLMSLAYVSGSRLLVKGVNHIWPIERGEYTYVASQLISTFLLNIFFQGLACLLAYWILSKPKK